MTRFITNGLPTLASFAFALLGALVLNADLKAECGDYVRVGGHSARQTMKPVNHPIPAAPCHGPGCSRRQAPLTPAPAPPTSQSSNDWFCLSKSANALRNESVGRVELSELRLLSEISLGIFHPPRPSPCPR